MCDNLFLIVSRERTPRRSRDPLDVVMPLVAWHGFALLVSWMIVLMAPMLWKVIVIALWLLYGWFVFSLLRDVVSHRRRHSRGTK